MNKAKNLILLAAAALALAIAAAAGAASYGASLSLVAYSTPKPVLTKIIQALELAPGQIVYVRPIRQTVFEGS